MIEGARLIANGSEERLIYPADPAVNARKSDLDGYVRTLDRSKLITDGTETIFVVRALDGEECDECAYRGQCAAELGGGWSGSAFSSAYAHAAFRLGVKRIENVPMNGSVGELPSMYWDRLPGAMRMAIGNLIIHLSTGAARNDVPK